MSDKSYTVTINNQIFVVSPGQSLFSVMLENGILKLKKNAVLGDMRFGACGMGTCFECEVFIEDRGVRRSCLINVDTNLRVKVGI